MHHKTSRFLIAVPILANAVAGFAADYFTIQIGTPAGVPVTVVNHSDTWNYRRGTNEPQANWRTAAAVDLDSTWLSGAGGLGYGDAGIQGEATTITGMRNVHSSLYLRREFQLTSAVDPAAELRLRVDFDDGFVAYLDGVELLRNNIAGASNSPVAFNALASGSREGSCCNNPTNPPTTYTRGAVGDRLSAGTHALSFIVLNDDLNSSDLHIIPDLIVAESQSSSGIVDNGLYAISSSNTLVLAGSNTVAGSTRMTVNGDDASFNSASGTWSKTQALSPGMNRLFIAALDAAGNLLSNLTQDIVYEVASVNAGGTLSANTAWTNVNEVIHVTSNVTVTNGATLTIGPGVVVIVSPGVSIRASPSGAINVQGVPEREVFFLPATTGVWGEIAAEGAGSSLAVQHADINRGAVKFRNGAAGLLEDSSLHEFKSGSVPIAGCTSASSVVVRRCRFNVYHETLWQLTPILIEDCLFENANNDSSDALDFDGAPVGSIIRRCTFRYGPNSNTDAIDIGSISSATLIESCIMRGFPNDKGVSIGEDSFGITIRNCLMYGNDSGVAVKDDCTTIVENCTIANCDFGFKNFNKANPNAVTGGGHITNAVNNILWNNITNISLLNASTLTNATYNDFGNTNWPGVGNISADPLFANAAAGDYRLIAGSPAIGSGRGGANMGVSFPIGGIPSAPTHLAAVVEGTNFVSLAWREDADNENAFLIERSTDAVNWEQIGSADANQTNFTDLAGEFGQKYYYRARATNDSGASPVSNIASAARQAPLIYVGGTISADTIWRAGVTVVVTSSVTVVSGVTLTIEPGVTVLFNDGLNLTVNGVLLAEGEADNRILFTRNTGATTWGGIRLAGSSSTHRIRFADFGWSASDNINANGTTVFLENLGWTNTTAQVVDVVNSSITLLNSYIPGGNGNEPVHFSDMPADGHALIQGNIFGAPRDYNDSIDFTGGNRSGPVVQFINNVFLAAVDDCLDLDGTDAHIEGNIFMNVHQDAVRASTANAISTGADNPPGTNTSEIVAVRNIFYDCDHAVLLKDFGSAIFENNTVVTIRSNQFSRTPAAYIQFGEPHRNFPGGRGILMNGNIFWDLRSPIPFLWFTNGPMFMIANQNIIQGTNIAGGDNSTSDPMFVNWQTGITHENIRSNLALLPGSPAIGSGPNGLDRGALVPGGASVSGEPGSVTSSNSVTLRVNGPGIYAYRWKLNDGPWSAEVPLTNSILITPTMFDDAAPIVLTNLTNGTYKVSVIGKNSAGAWQDDATLSRTWTVSTSVDTDGDGMPDDWEDAHMLNRLVDDADGDADDDGVTNLAEYRAGTDPQDNTSRLALEIISANSSECVLQFTAVANRSYMIQSRDSLSEGDWQFRADVPSETVTRTRSFTDSLPPGLTSRFYRVVLSASP